MAKKRPKKGAAKVDPDREVVVTWANAFNCDRSACQTLAPNVAGAIARGAGYEFMAHNHVVFYIPPEGDTVNTGVSSGKLDGGVKVLLNGDREFLGAEPRARKKYVVMAASWSYNDEYYYRDDSDAGRPTDVYDTLQEAEAVARERTIADVCGSDNPFEYLGEDEYAYESCVGMPYQQWYDWLQDKGVDPPTDDPDNEPDREMLETWWQVGRGTRSWRSGSYQDVPGTWNPDQRRAAAEHILVDFHEVVEVDYGGA